MSPERFSGPPPLLVGVVPGQHPEVLQTAVALAQKLSAPLLCAYVDEASYLVEWDPARSAHRLSLHPDKDDDDIRSLTNNLKSAIGSAVPSASPEWPGSPTTRAAPCWWCRSGLPPMRTGRSDAAAI
jgi:hypothetical protein